MVRRFPRKKKRHLWLSIGYRLSLLPFAPGATKLRLFLNAEWFFSRVAHEQFTREVPPTEHPLRLGQLRFLLPCLPADCAVLDLGSGFGHLAAAIAPRVRRILGVDHNPASVAAASNTYSHEDLAFETGDARRYLVESGEDFDVLLLSHVLEHLDDPGDFLTTFAPRFRYLFVEVPDFESSYLNLYREFLGLELSYTDADHIHEFGHTDLTELLQGAGLEVLQYESVHGVQRVWCRV